MAREYAKAEAPVKSAPSLSGKVAFDKRALSYRIHTWVEVPPLFQFIRELGVSLESCLAVFNWGIGYYIFVPPSEVSRTISIGQKAGYQLTDVGFVEKGERKVIFEPEGITLPPPESRGFYY